MKQPSTSTIYSYETEHEARGACHRMNKEAGKKIYIVVPDRNGEEWLVIHKDLLTNN
jgi:hypothetical protein